METYSLYELNEYIRRVIALNFEEAIWIECEISQVSSVRGNVYMDLIQKGDENEDIIAKASAQIWYKSRLFIEKKLGSLFKTILEPGIKIKCKVLVEFSERYGFGLNIQDVDASYTLGTLEIEKQKIIARLKDDGFFDVNRGIAFPSVIQRIAVISAETAAGFADFRNQLATNSYGYDIEIELFASAMQGQNTERDVVAAIKAINNRVADFDCIVIIRGGGSRIDLSFFDNYNIAAEISKNALPVVVGIGHEIDESITDLVSAKSVKTPTAAADWIIEHNLYFESELILLQEAISRRASQLIQEHQMLLQSVLPQLQMQVFRKIEAQRTEIQWQAAALKEIINGYVKFHTDFLDQAQRLTEWVDPKQLLKKGFSIVSQDGKLVNRKSQLQATSTFEIEFSDGTIKIHS